MTFLFPENLTFTDDPKEITHPQVGKYFNEFCHNHYMPNDVKQEEYPEDYTHTLQARAGRGGERADQVSVCVSL